MPHQKGESLVPGGRARGFQDGPLGEGGGLAVRLMLVSAWGEISGAGLPTQVTACNSVCQGGIQVGAIQVPECASPWQQLTVYLRRRFSSSMTAAQSASSMISSLRKAL